MKRRGILSIAILAFGALASSEFLADLPQKPREEGAVWEGPMFDLPPELHKEFGPYRKNWERLTEFEFSGLHWKQFVVIFANRESDEYLYNYSQYVEQYLDDGWEEPIERRDFKNYSQGTIFLKEHFTPENGKPLTPSFITAMKKMKPGYDPKYGDWKYYWLGGGGSVIEIGNSSNKNLMTSCIECHANMADRDYVFATFSKIGAKKIE
ncbi:MAG: cytochrome P460 family protein [Verrucomicrobiota bacterium]